MVTAPAAQAQPAATRQADGRIDKDPIQPGCSGDAQTVAYVNYGHQQLQLRYGNTCKAAWARLVNAVVGTPFQVEESSGGRVVAEITLIPPGCTTGYSNQGHPRGRLPYRCPGPVFWPGCPSGHA
ncbi:DUF2690 domain-containing protein [Streptomyces sp. NPDC048192]|uniref:DUF2690 domain-containing protein n=1 Tax=Streptomyces sp. NPDC048192 TaxID=3365510 RepID=UPI003722EF20